MKYDIEGDVVSIDIASGEDLWYLSLLLGRGDVVLADVLRRVERKEDSLRNKKTERERIRVSIRVESVEFMELSYMLHVLGSIVSGPEEYIGEHQSINVELGSTVKVIPADRDAFLKNIRESAEITDSSVLVLSADDKNISLYSVSESRDELIWKVQTGSGKMYDGRESDYFYDLIERLGRYKKSEIYVIGPSIFRDSISKKLSQNGFNSINTQVGSSEEEGIRELLQGGVVNLRRSTENKLVSDFLRMVGTGSSTYGVREVERMLEIRAVSVLLVTDRFFRSSVAASYMRKCHEGGCRVFVVHSSWETGKIVDSYGGIVAILRYRVDYSSAGK